MQRHEIILKKPNSNAIKPETRVIEVAREFIQKIRTLLATGTYDTDFVVNIDETGVNLEQSNSKTLEFRTTKRVRAISTGKDRDSTTVLLGGTLSGKKLPAFIIPEGTGKKKVKTLIPDNIYVYYRQEGSWIDREGMKYWIRNVLTPFSRKKRFNAIRWMPWPH